jgi:hypothetical protein
MESITGKVVNITIDGGTQLDLVEEDSVSFDAGESTNDFASGAKEITETFHETASPTFEWTSTISASTAGLEEAGVIDDGADGGDTVKIGGNRRLSTVKMEYLDAESGTVEFALEIPSGTLEWGGFDGQSPPTMDFTLHVNEKPTIDNQETTA